MDTFNLVIGTVSYPITYGKKYILFTKTDSSEVIFVHGDIKELDKPIPMCLSNLAALDGGNDVRNEMYEKYKKEFSHNWYMHYIEKPDGYRLPEHFVGIKASDWTPGQKIESGAVTTAWESRAIPVETNCTEEAECCPGPEPKKLVDKYRRLTIR